jgi:hypothetical protein
LLGDTGLFGGMVDNQLVGGLLGKVGSPVLRAGLSAVVASGITQGMATATGLQKKFDWAGVAAAGIGALAGQGIASKAYGLGRFGGRAITSAASAIANAATRTAIQGTDFGDNILAALPDVIMQTIGGLLVDRASGTRNRPQRIVDANGDELIVGDPATPQQVAAAQAMADLAMSNASPLQQVDDLIQLAANTHALTASDVYHGSGVAAWDGKTPSELPPTPFDCSLPENLGESAFDEADLKYKSCIVINAERLDRKETQFLNRLSGLGITDTNTMRTLANFPLAQLFSDRGLLAFVETEIKTVERAPNRDPPTMAAKAAAAAAVTFTVVAADLLGNKKTLQCSDI